MVKVNIDSNKINGALVVLENYLDGALADYENGDVEDNPIIEDSIYVHKLLKNTLSPFNSLIKDEYEQKYLKIKGDR